jgi:hypothetical protein
MTTCKEDAALAGRHARNIGAQFAVVTAILAFVTAFLYALAALLQVVVASRGH